VVRGKGLQQRKSHRICYMHKTRFDTLRSPYLASLELRRCNLIQIKKNSVNGILAGVAAGCLVSLFSACGSQLPSNRATAQDVNRTSNRNESDAGERREESTSESLDRTVLPIQEPKRPTYSELDVRKVKAPSRFEVKAPKKAPNVVIVLIDDVGFGATSTFGGPIQTPTLDRLASAGIRFNNFHTTALCSPTRMALKTGRNHHTCNTGSIMETATTL